MEVSTKLLEAIQNTPAFYDYIVDSLASALHDEFIGEFEMRENEIVNGTGDEYQIGILEAQTWRSLD
jgi:hypothetical protein